MRAILCFIFSALIYSVGGLLVWNIVSEVIDVETLPLMTVANYELITYSAFTAVVSLVITYFVDGAFEDVFNWALFVVGGNFFLMLFVSNWGAVWESVHMGMVIVYNIVNLVFMTAVLYAATE